MPAFNVGSSVEQLDYDLTGRKPDGTYIPDWPSALANARGTLREPSDAAIGKLLDGLKNLYKEMKDIIGTIEGLDESDPGAALAALDQVTGEDFEKMMGRITDLYAELCGGSPSREQIGLLPLRARTAFFDWLMREVVRPEGGKSDGAQVVNLRPAAATG